VELTDQREVIPLSPPKAVSNETAFFLS
jgi:hypothetical protein